MTGDRPVGDVEFLGLRFGSQDLDAARLWVIERLRGGTFAYLVTPNVDHIVLLHRARGAPHGESIDRAYDDADLRLCDSRVLALLARLSGLALSVVPGSDLTARLLCAPLPAGTKIALIGGDEAQLRWLATARPETCVVQHRPPMGLRTDPAARAAVAAFIEAAGADLVLLTVGAPQSEIVAQLVKGRGRAGGVALCVGASLEFLTGAKRRAPRTVQAMHLEWAFRLLSEPGRLWRRYLADGPAVFGIWRAWRRRQARQESPEA